MDKKFIVIYDIIRQEGKPRYDAKVELVTYDTYSETLFIDAVNIPE